MGDVPKVLPFHWFSARLVTTQYLQPRAVVTTCMPAEAPTAGWDAHKQMAQPVVADAKVGLEAIDAAIGDYAAPAEWLRSAQAMDRRSQGDAE